MLEIDEAITLKKTAGEDTFPFVKLALEKAGQHHNVIVVCSSVASAWLFTCIAQTKLGRPTPPPPFFQRGAMAYELLVPEHKPKDPFDRPTGGFIAFIPRKKARETFTARDGYNVSDVFVEKRKEYQRMTLLEWQESEGLVRKQSVDRFERLDRIEGRGKGLNDFPKRSWLEVERVGYKRKLVCQRVAWPMPSDFELVRDARGVEHRVRKQDILSVVRVRRPKNAV